MAQTRAGKRSRQPQKVLTLAEVGVEAVRSQSRDAFRLGGRLRSRGSLIVTALYGFISGRRTDTKYKDINIDFIQPEEGNVFFCGRVPSARAIDCVMSQPIPYQATPLYSVLGRNQVLLFEFIAPANQEFSSIS